MNKKRLGNKGFTLIELVAVIVILLGISLTAVISISSSLERRDVKECEEQQQLAVNAAKIYFSLNSTDIDVTVSELKEDKYFTGDKKIDRLNDGDVITISDNKYLYNGGEIGDSCS